MQQFSKKIGLSTYGRETNISLTLTVVLKMPCIDSAMSALSKIKAADSDSKEIVKRAEANLDEGAKVLTIRQKHINITNCFDLIWATVKHYIAEPLVAGPEDKREIARSEKEALKEQERANAKRLQNMVVVGSGSQDRTTSNGATDLSRIAIYRLEYIMLSNILSSNSFSFYLLFLFLFFFILPLGQ